MQSVSDVSGSLTPRTAEMSADIYDLIVREIPQLRGDKRVVTLLEAGVGENVATLLHIIQHGIELENVRAPAAAEEYARRLAQRGVPASALLRAYRIGSARFQDWFLEELGRSTDNASIVSAAALRIADITSTYIDKVSEELLSFYEAEKEGWLRNRSVARAARVQALLRASGSMWCPPRRSWDTGSGSTTLAWRAGVTGQRRAVALWVGWSRRPRSWPARRVLRASRSSCRKTNPARGPGYRSPPRTPSPPCARSEQIPASGSLSARPVPASPASAVPTSKHWAHRPSRWRQAGRDSP